MAEYLTNKEIAERLGISLKTADKLTHVIFGKLRARGGRTEAVTMWNSAH
jgi:DNA-binding NarL/FixJ family response regulator